MSEKDLGKALLNGEGPIDLAALTEGVLRRDRRRMWLLGIACIIAWMLVVMLPWGTVLPMLAKIMELQSQNIGNAEPVASQARQAETLLMLQVVKKGTVATIFGSIISMFIAASCTVLLIVMSRRATLRQINARLAEISAQLKAMVKNPER